MRNSRHTRIPRHRHFRRAPLHLSLQLRRVLLQCVQHPLLIHVGRCIVTYSISTPVVSNCTTFGELLYFEVATRPSCSLKLTECQSYSMLDLPFRDVSH